MSDAKRARKAKAAPPRRRASLRKEDYRLIADTTCDWEDWWSPEGRLLYVSPSCERISGYPAQEFLDDPGLLERIVHPEDREALQSCHGALERPWPDDGVQLRIVRPDGEVRWVQRHGQTIHDADGAVLGRRTSTHDITAAKQAEAERERLLAELEGQRRMAEEAAAEAHRTYETLRTIVDTMPAGVIICDASGEITLANQYIHRLTGGITGDAYGPTDAYTLCHVDGSEFLPEELPLPRAIMRGETTQDLKVMLRLQSGQEVMTVAGAGPVRDAQGGILGAAAVLQDITEHQQQEQRIAYLASFPELNPSPVLELDRSGAVVYRNPATVKALGGVEDLAGAEVFVPEDLDCLLGELQNSDANAALLREVRVGDAVFLLRLCWVPQSERVRLYATPITERIAQEERIARQAAELEAVLSSIGEGVAVYGPDGTVLSVNDAGLRIVGLTGQALPDVWERQRVKVEMRLASGELLAPENVPSRCALRGDRVSGLLVTARRDDGSTVWLSMTGAPVPGHAGDASIAGAVVTFSDVTPLMTAQQEAQRRAAEVEAILASMADGVTVYGLDGKVLRANDAVSRILGFGPEQARLPWEERLKLLEPRLPSGEPLPLNAAPHLRAAAGETIVDSPLVVRRGDGQDIGVSLSAAPVRDVDGEIVATVVSFRDMTPLIEAREEAQRRAAWFETVIESIAEGVVVYDNQGGISRTNRAALVSQHLEQRAPDETLSERVTRMLIRDEEDRPFPPDRLPSVRALRGEVVRSQVTHVQQPDGSWKWFETSSSPLCDKAGSVTGAVATFRDITELREIQEELRHHRDHLEQLVSERSAEVAERSRLLASVFNNSLSSLVLLDPQFNFIRVNETYAHACGRPVEDFVGHNHFIDYPSAELQQAFEQAVATKTPWSIAGRPFTFPGHPDWGVTYWDLSLVPLLDPTGEVEMLLFSLQDVSERKRAEELAEQRAAETVRSERRYRELVESANSAILQYDREGSITLANRYAERLFGYGPGEMLGEQVMVLVPAVDQSGQNLTGLREAIMADPEAFETYENENITRDGRLLWMSWANRVLLDEEGLLEGVMAIGVDRSVQHQAERELLRVNRVHAVLSRASEAIVRTRTRAELFREVCRGAVEHGGFRMAWIGILDPTTSRVVPYAHWGHEDGYLSEITISAEQALEGRGPTGRAIRDGVYQICNDIATDPVMAPWAEPATRRGYRSSGAFPFQIGATTGALTIYSDEPGFFDDQRSGLLQALAINLALAAERDEAERNLVAHQDQLRKLATELSLESERERRRIAASIHDDLIQNLAFAKMKLALTRRANPPAEVVDGLDAVNALLEEAIRYMRGLTFEISLPLLYQLGLEPALEWLAEHMQERHGYVVRLVTDAATPPLSQDLRVTLFQAVRELLTNAAKHAQAGEVVVLVRCRDEGLEVTVADDGVGFDASAMDGGLTSGFGLFHLRERLQYLGGQLTIQSAPGAGARFTLFMPLAEDPGRS